MLTHIHTHRYVLSDLARGKPTFEENNFKTHSNMGAMFPHVRGRNYSGQKEFKPPARILQDQVDHFEAPLLGFRRRGTYTLRSSDDEKIGVFNVFDRHLHENQFYRVFKPNSLLIDDHEDSKDDHVLYAKCRLKHTIFDDITRIKMVRSILENPENQCPR